MASLPPALLAEAALRAAREAADLVARGWRQGVRASEKGRLDLVTEYDLASERLVRTRLAELTPDIPVLGEEEGVITPGPGSATGSALPAAVGSFPAQGASTVTVSPAWPAGSAGSNPLRAGITEGPVWYCDPIDGTTNFVHGHPFFAVSIGLMAGGVPLAGAVVAPALGTAWSGAVGLGASRDAMPCHVSATARLSDALLATGFHPQSDPPTVERAVRSFARLLPEVRGIRRCGAATLDLCMVADGTYDAYWERKLAAWDTVAGAAIVLAAGGTITNLTGGPPDLTIGHIAVSNGTLHPALLAFLAPDAA